MDRFWEQVDKSGDCWLWTGSMRTGDESAYGQFNIDNRKFGAHRVAYELAYGPIPGDLCVLHTCDTPRCVRPDHLFLGTRADNNADKMQKGRARSSRGSSNPGARLSDEQVLTIRERAANGESQTALSQEYGVARTLIGMIARGQAWQHLEGARTPVAAAWSNTGYRGVSWDARRQEYQVYINYRCKRYPLGYVDDPVEGAKRYDAKARELGVPSKRLNFPD